MNKEFFEAVKALEKEKGIPAEYLYEKIKAAILVAVKKDYNGKDVISCEIDPESSIMNVFLHKTVVETVEDPLMREIRYLDKLVDELAKGRPLHKILRG